MTFEALTKSSVQIAIGIAIVMAFTYFAGAQVTFREPATAPPASNVAPPIHEGPDPQVKTGGLGILGNLIVGNAADAVTQYFQIDVRNLGIGLPSAADCNGESQLGKMFYDRGKNYLYICAVDDSTQTVRWKYLTPLSL